MSVDLKRNTENKSWRHNLIRLQAEVGLAFVSVSIYLLFFVAISCGLVAMGLLVNQ
jgi:hypothetical protein